MHAQTTSLLKHHSHQLFFCVIPTFLRKGRDFLLVGVRKYYCCERFEIPFIILGLFLLIEFVFNCVGDQWLPILLKLHRGHYFGDFANYRVTVVGLENLSVAASVRVC